MARAEAYLREKFHLDPCSCLATTDIGRKLGAVPLSERMTGSPSNTTWPEPRPTCLPSFIWIRPTVWPQYTKITDRQTYRQTDRTGQTVRQWFYKRSPNKISTFTHIHFIYSPLPIRGLLKIIICIVGVRKLETLGPLFSADCFKKAKFHYAIQLAHQFSSWFARWSATC